MKKKSGILSLVLLCLGTVPALALDVSVVEATIKQASTLACDGRVDTQWTSRDDALFFIDEHDGAVMRLDGSSGKREVRATPDDIAKALKRAGATPSPDIPLSLQSLSPDGKSLSVRTENAQWRYDIEERSVTRIEYQTGETHHTKRKRLFPTQGGFQVVQQASPSGAYIFELNDDGNIMLRSRGKRKANLLTADASRNRVYSLASDDLERKSWSPEESHVLVRSDDYGHITGRVLVDWLTIPENVSYFKQWGDRAGDPFVLTRYYIFNTASGDLVTAELPASTSHAATFLGWRPNSSEAWMLRADFAMNGFEVIAIDGETGATRIVLAEKPEGGIAGAVSVQQLVDRFAFHPDGEKFILLSDRSGLMNAYLYRANGRLERKLTPDDILVKEIDGIDLDTDTLFFHGSLMGERPYDTHFFRSSLSRMDAQRLTEGNGRHMAQLSPTFKFFVDVHDDYDRPASTELRTTTGERVAVLGEGDAQRTKQAGWSMPERFVVKAADGKTDMHGVLFKPRNLDPSKRYPVIEYIYGGPQTHVIRPRYMGWYCFQGRAPSNMTVSIPYLTDNGYAVVMMDAPGTTGRSRAYNLANRGKWPEGIIPDHAEGLRQVGEKFGYLNTDQIGMMGHSWGGYMSILAMIEAPTVYRAAVSSAPSVDPATGGFWEVAPIGGPPSTNKEAYAYADLTRRVSSINGPLQIFGAMDDINAP
ncbi:MAG: alpha/beta fold hydrolase, partial [Pseudomonadota bacterium]